MKVVVTITALHSAIGGPARTVPALCRAMAREGIEVELITISEGKEEASQDKSVQEFKLTRIATRTSRYAPLSWHRQFNETLARAIASPDPVVLYDVGLWLPQNHLVVRFAHARGLPLMISPRGMLSRKALEVSKWKKRLAWLAYQKSDLQIARVLHVTSETEAEDCRHRGLTQPIALIPNGIDVPPTKDRKEAKGESRSALFLSRLHPIKGLKDLVEAWARARPAGWRVVVAGPDEDGHRKEVETLVDKLSVREQFDFIGAVDDEEKWKLYSEADLFVLPSYSESFGQAIGEALAAGVPVITTRATPWREIETNRCGWWIETGVDSLAKALSVATSSSDIELQEMGKRGRELILASYSWRSSAEKMISVMKWLTGEGVKPLWLI